MIQKQRALPHGVMRRILYLFCILQAQPVNPKVFYTVPVDTWFMSPQRIKMFYKSVIMTFIGVRLMLVGLLGILTWSMGHWHRVVLLFYMMAFRIIQPIHVIGILLILT